MSADHLSKSINWTNKSLPFVINRPIVEYDMRRAGMSVIKEYHLLDEATIDKLENMGKKKADVSIGKLRAKNKEFSKAFGDSMTKARELFISSNHLEENDIISIKNDAFFIIGECENCKFGEIEFRPKNRYTSFLNLSRIELYYNPEQIDPKGLGESVRFHENYWLKTLSEIINLMESGAKKSVILYMRNLADKYKSFRLPVDYYRDFDVQSKYHTMSGDVYGEYWDTRKEELDIGYNYEKIVVPLVLMSLKFE